MKIRKLMDEAVKMNIRIPARLNEIINNSTILKKIFFVPSVAIACILVLGIIFCGFLISQRLIIDEIFEKRFYIFKQSSEIVIKINQANTGMHKALLWAQAGYDKKQVEKLLNEQLAGLDEATVLIKKILAEDSLEPQERRTFNSVLKKNEEFRTRALFAKESTIDAEDVTTATMMLQMGDDQFSLLYDDLNQLMKIQDKISRESQDSSHNKIWLFIFFVILFVLISLMLSLFTSVVVASFIVNPVKHIINVLRENTGWDVDLEELKNVNSKDEIGEFAQYFIKYILEIKTTTLALIEARDELWGEMKLAKKIQTILLPVVPVLPGYEVTVHMTPADEVGGDYYDVINIAGINWIVIGDVSGHGVPAGLVMMMLQTSIKTVLYKNPHTLPSILLSDINRVLTSNIKSLGEDKFITITIFACFPDGRFIFSGLHEDIMIYRNGKNSVEIIKTKGMWLGIRDDIKIFLEDDELILEKDDVLLLYTDGITEAFDQYRNIFSKNKLIHLLEQSGRKSTDEIKTEILSQLEEYKKHDDITMIVLKRTE